MFYKTTNEGAAEYLGNLVFDVTVKSAESGVGERINSENYTYKCQIIDIAMHVKRIRIDSFIDDSNTLVCHVYVPESKFYIKTKELSKSYGYGNENLSFSGISFAKRLKIQFDSIDVKKYEVISMIEDEIAKNVYDYLTDQICEHNMAESWKVQCPDVKVTFEKHLSV